MTFLQISAMLYYYTNLYVADINNTIVICVVDPVSAMFLRLSIMSQIFADIHNIILLNMGTFYRRIFVEVKNIFSLVHLSPDFLLLWLSVFTTVLCFICLTFYCHLYLLAFILMSKIVFYTGNQLTI